ncbi:MAG: twin-arginine translocase TatA/TatE family subunit [Actinomycetota bacterium]|nr:twin-arginine translocase TatA/TatE family subunit [Actinomycetota bacterium]
MALAFLNPDGFAIIAVIIAVIFGANKLPKLARNVGEASKEFKKAQAEAEAEDAKAKALEAAKPATTDDKITMSKAELDALIAEREAKARRESERPPAN